jgi:TonB-linked SusC/RagA family outer membrane protein
MLLRKKACKNFINQLLIMERIKLIKCWKTLLLLIGMSLFSGTIFAQGITIRGHVTDSKGEPLIGANVHIKATPATAASTNISGDFVLRVPANTTMLTVSYIGYVSLDIPITPSSGNLGQIPLANDANSLSEVVVVGYGVQNKRDITGATTSVDAAQLAEIPATNISSQLEGKVAGLDVVSASGGLGATPSIHLRGNRTIGAGVNDAADQPLLVVDGIPYTGSINDINPGDIKNVEILKDASSTAIYGSRGANGVILITTNRGRAGRAITSLNSYYGAGNVIGDLKMLTGQQYAQLKTDAVTVAGYDNTTPTTQTYPLTSLEATNLANGMNTDWQKALYQTAYVADNNISISGGSESTQFNVGAGYRVETAVEPNNRRERYSLQTVIDHKISKTIRVGVNVTNTLTYLNTPGGFQGLNAAQTSPLMPVFNSPGVFDAFPYTGQLDASYPSALYPKYNSSAFYNNTRTFHNFSSIYAEWSILKDLKYKITAGYDFTQTLQGQYNGVNSSNSITTQAQTTASTTNSEGYHYTLENLLTYDKTFAQKHHLTVTALFSSEKNHTDGNYVAAQGIPSDVNRNANLALGTFTSNTYPNGNPYTELGLVSEMARVNYSFDGRLALTATIRNDANSALAAGHQYLTYPAIGAAWTITNEKWMQKYSDVIDNLKLRGGYGITSNGALGTTPYQTLGALTSTNGGGALTYEYSGNAAGNNRGYLVGTLANPALTWQKTAEYNFGFDFGLLKDRLTGTIDVYSEKTTGILLQNVLPATTGATAQTSNLGTSADKGLEIALSSINFQNKGGFSWTTDFNIAFSREHIVALPNGVPANVNTGEFVGWPLNVVYDAKKIGIWQVADAPSKGAAVSAQTSPLEYPGQIRVQDVDHNGIINAADNQIVGTFQPQYTGGITNRFAYKNFDLSVVIQARMGQIAVLPYLSSGGSTGGWAYLGTGRHNQPYTNYWTPSNPTGTFPGPNQQLQSYPFASTTQYYDGSWIKAKSINFGYNIPSAVLAHAGISSLRVYVNCTNPFIIYSPLSKVDDGLDPEGNAVGGGVAGANNGNAAAGRAPSVNYTSDPTQRNFILGINLRF